MSRRPEWLGTDHATDTTEALAQADTRCDSGVHLPAIVRRRDRIYDAAFRLRPTGEIYCRNCMSVLGGPQ